MSITDIDMFSGLDKEQTALALIQSFQPVIDYYVANSGGKDSTVAEHLTMRSGAAGAYSNSNKND